MTSVSVYSTTGGCTWPPEGTVQAKPGESVTLFWVDRYGRRGRAPQTLVVDKP